MEFTHCYSNLLKANGVPHIGVRQYQYTFNIMVLEVRISEQNKIHQSITDSDSKALLYRRSYDLYNKLNTLTKGKEPKDIMKAIIESI
ncbi:hypothetical protein DFQ09_11060 [Winogradskyella pacifica]|uniref:Uncharacterized protein n=1 Tax=Winogradskyella pacifica TaxID=664642 RepID=A0A3D9LMH2_9FLAO|nr:hypothetical protein DFQ09_11060 [Winogradskyella pacifica]